jgi:hypothetical protein
MTTRTRRLAALALLVLPLLGACASRAAIYVPPGDPALTVCQAPDVQAIGSLVQAVDNANGTDPAAGWTGESGQPVSDGQAADLRRAASGYRQYANQVTGHPALARALRNEAQVFAIAVSSPTGLTTNTVAVSADTLSGEITGTCAALQVGTAPKAARPGPGIWDWKLAGFALGGYLLAALAASYVIAIGQRVRPRRDRLSPGAVAGRALVWWVFIFAAAAAAWRHAISAAVLTPDERKDDRIAAQQQEIQRLETKLRRPGDPS